MSDHRKKRKSPAKELEKLELEAARSGMESVRENWRTLRRIENRKGAGIF